MENVRPIDLILEAYREGAFPMAESAKDPSFAFYKPSMRALIPIADFHIPSSLMKRLRQKPYRVTVDQAFGTVIDGCAAATPARSKTWINKPIRDLFVYLHEAGYAHSVECWDADGTLAGGLYGLAIGAVFCGESMVSFQKDASKIALVHLCALLSGHGFTVLDSQFMNPHLLQFGAYEMPQDEYESLIETEMAKQVSFAGAAPDMLLAAYLEKRRHAAGRQGG